MDWTWDLREEKGNTRVLFGAWHDDLVFHDALPFPVELTFLLLFWETFSLRLSWQVQQWCQKEVPVGDVNLATCLPLGLTWLQLLTPVVGIATRDMHPPASGLENCPLFYTRPRCKPCIFSRALDYQSTFNQQKHHKYCSFSKLWLSRHLFFLIALEIQEYGGWIN